MAARPPTDLETYLADATGLSVERTIHLYRVGQPWPLGTTYTARLAAIYAQAYGLPLADAMAASEKAAAAQYLEMLGLCVELLRAEDQADARQKGEALGSLPFLKEIIDHCERVMLLTQEEPNTIARLCRAIQQFAIDHPNWDQGQSAGQPTQ